MEQINAPILKNCPFCGGKAYLFVDSGVRVCCSCCNAQTQILCDMRSGNNVPSGSAVERVVTLWNRRTEMGM